MPTNGFLTDDDRRYLRPVDHLWYSEERLIDIADAREKEKNSTVERLTPASLAPNKGPTTQPK